MATAGPCKLLAIDQDGPIVVDAQRTKDRGVRYDGVLYPDELLKDLGAGVFMLASHLLMPADGNVTHNAPFEPLTVVGQLDWTASWESYDRARRRLNADALWERGGAMSGVIKNMLFAVILCVSVFTAWGGFRASAAASDLAREVSDLRGALYRVIEPAPGAAAPATLTPTVGAPTGDRQPTVVPRRP